MRNSVIYWPYTYVIYVCVCVCVYIYNVCMHVFIVNGCVRYTVTVGYTFISLVWKWWSENCQVCIYRVLCFSRGGKYIYLYFFIGSCHTVEYTIGICFETAKNTKAFECFFTGFRHSLWKFSTTEKPLFSEILAVIGCRCICCALSNQWCSFKWYLAHMLYTKV